jgi:2-polyprenyl-6-methoxyphenol hydroxylase-like FAD-dependent oxidoreductase
MVALLRDGPGLDPAGSGSEFTARLHANQASVGHVARYGAPGAVIMGDAAHSVSPAGGQGANMSVADAVVLAELMLRGEPNLVAEYERRRRPANERSLGPTRFAHTALGLPGWIFPNLCRRGLLRWLGRHPGPVQRTLRSVSALFRESLVPWPAGRPPVQLIGSEVPGDLRHILPR